MTPECQEKNAKGLTMVAIGMNKAADELMILDERTREDLATGKYRDQRRGSFGTSIPAGERGAAAAATPRAAQPAGRPVRKRQPQRPAPARPAATPAWTPRQERLARIYNQQGLRPDEIAQKLGISAYLATQIVLAARNSGRA